MYLHEDKKTFEEVVLKTQQETGIDSTIIEKDYYVTMMLKRLADCDMGFIFKGGTSLSKAYKAINRFSEDIDLAVEKKPTRAEGKALFKSIMELGNQIGLRLINSDEIRTHGNFNRFIFEYDSVVTKNTVVSPKIIIELLVLMRSFPVEYKIIDSFVGSTLAIHNENAAKQYGLQPFKMSVQSIKRTFIDKVFALCDYYLDGKSQRLSRHIYDLYQIMPTLQDIDVELVNKVRKERTNSRVCLSAKDGKDPSKILSEIVKENFFKDDYNLITTKLLYDNVPYEKAIEAINKIIESNLFTPNH